MRDADSSWVLGNRRLSHQTGTRRYIRRRQLLSAAKWLAFAHTNPYCLDVTTNNLQEEVSDREVDYAANVNDNFRNRARSASTLTGAAAGTLAAGLILSPESLSMSIPGRVCGLVSVGLLAVSTGLFMAASLDYFPSKKGKRFSNIQLIEMADQLLSRIQMQLRIAKYLSGASVISFLAAIALITLVPSPQIPVLVQMKGPTPAVPGCPALRSPFEGSVSEETLGATGSFIPISLERGVCGKNSEKMTVHLSRQDIMITGWR